MDGSDMHFISDDIFGMRADDGDMEACAGERAAFLMKNARIERTVNGRHVHDFCGFIHSGLSTDGAEWLMPSMRGSRELDWKPMIVMQ
jgi:hypothetical protein